jgi:hypothetical protein
MIHEDGEDASGSRGACHPTALGAVAGMIGIYRENFLLFFFLWFSMWSVCAFVCVLSTMLTLMVGYWQFGLLGLLCMPLLVITSGQTISMTSVAFGGDTVSVGDAWKLLRGSKLRLLLQAILPPLVLLAILGPPAIQTDFQCMYIIPVGLVGIIMVMAFRWVPYIIVIERESVVQSLLLSLRF